MNIDPEDDPLNAMKRLWKAKDVGKKIWRNSRA